MGHHGHLRLRWGHDVSPQSYRDAHYVLAQRYGEHVAGAALAQLRDSSLHTTPGAELAGKDVRGPVDLKSPRARAVIRGARGGSSMMPVLVAHVGDQTIVADGAHRVAVAADAGDRVRFKEANIRA